jgi:A/G-specific adenine glycosylase
MDKEREISRFLIEYYRHNGRYYEWRYNRTPYSVYLSEILLQRTRADQVAPVFNNLIQHYPDLKSLASSFSAVRAAMGTLGRNVRFEPFENGLNYIIREHQGELPFESEKLLEVPGIGPYIAAAIRIFGFNIKDAIIDTNVVRVVSRLYGLDYHAETRRNKEFILLANSLVPEEGYVEYSYGILDFASAICTVAKPKCQNCNISHLCTAKHSAPPNTF